MRKQIPGNYLMVINLSINNNARKQESERMKARYKKIASDHSHRIRIKFPQALTF